MKTGNAESALMTKSGDVQDVPAMKPGNAEDVLKTKSGDVQDVSVAQPVDAEDVLMTTSCDAKTVPMASPGGMPESGVQANSEETRAIDSVRTPMTMLGDVEDAMVPELVDA